MAFPDIYGSIRPTASKSDRMTAINLSGDVHEVTSCARTLPFTNFPGIKRAVRLEYGIRQVYTMVTYVH